MNRTARVIECTEEEEDGVEKSTTEPKVEETTLQESLKKLTKQITKYKRQLMKATSEEEQRNIKMSIDYINNLRFILKMSQPNRCIINRVLAYIDSPIDYQKIVDDAIAKIGRDEI